MPFKIRNMNDPWKSDERLSLFSQILSPTRQGLLTFSGQYATYTPRDKKEEETCLETGKKLLSLHFRIARNCIQRTQMSIFPW